MRVILIFDLPVVTKTDQRNYATFRKYLIKNGYIMIQYSVYSKIFNNRDSAIKHIEILKRHVPNKGHIRLMLVTEKQYARQLIIIGGKTNEEKILTVDPFILL